VSVALPTTSIPSTLGDKELFFLKQVRRRELDRSITGIDITSGAQPDCSEAQGLRVKCFNNLSRSIYRVLHEEDEFCWYRRWNYAKDETHGIILLSEIG
jgi:hypothetical protein